MKNFLSLAVVIFVGAVSADDLVVIRGGREIHGRVLEETPTHLSFYSDYGKRLQIHKSKISIVVRNGDVLAMNPAVGTIVGITAEGDVAKGASATGDALKKNNLMKSNEPVTSHSNPLMVSNREVASTVSSEVIVEGPLGLRVGAVLGVTQSGASAATSTQSRIGAEAGIVAEIPFLQGLHLHPELLLSQAGYQEGAATLKYSYIKIPVLLKYSHPINEKFSLAAFAGPSLGFRTDAKRELAGVSTDKSSTTKSTLIAADLGLGGEYVFSSKMNFFLNLRYSTQLNNLDTTIGAVSSIKLRQLSFLSGFLFSI